MDIYNAINKVMKDVGAIGKEDKNPQQGYKYRGIDAVMNALQPAMVKHGIFVVPDVVSQTREERQTSRGGNLIYSVVHVKYTFYAEDGSSIEASVVGEGMDSGDKASNKAMSAAFKYACFQTFCIPTEEMKDSEEDSPELVAKKHQPITDSHAAEIKSLLEEKGADVPKFLEYFKVASVEKLTEEQYIKAHKMLMVKK